MLKTDEKVPFYYLNSDADHQQQRKLEKKEKKNREQKKELIQYRNTV